jgi:hypothetical protein
MSEQNKLDHDHPGNPGATNLDTKHLGITNKPVEESERQTKVVEGDQREEPIPPSRNHPN